MRTNISRVPGSYAKCESAYHITRDRNLPTGTHVCNVIYRLTESTLNQLCTATVAAARSDLAVVTAPATRVDKSRSNSCV